MLKINRLIIIIPVCFTILVGGFSWSTLQTAPQVAAENLRGAALSTATAIEQLTAINDGNQALASYSTPDTAFFSLTDRHGIIRFHTNAALIGTTTNEPFQFTGKENGFSEERKKLGTGEEIYLLRTILHHDDNDFLLTLALHTYRADQVIRRARTGVTVVALLTIALWVVTIGLIRLLQRDEQRQREMHRREELARIGEMGAVMAHEIRNPLGGIKGFAQLVGTATSLEQARDYADRIVQQSLRMESLVTDLLNFARNDQEERQQTDLAALVQDCVNLIRMEADSTGVEVVHTPHREIKMAIVHDRIIQLLLNLMKNGLQSMPDGGKLLIEVILEKRLVVTRVTDTGIGIPPENITHIFEPFWTSKAQGTGLGLALCRKIAMEHDGNLTVTSMVGSGTTFSLTLPLADR